MENGRARADQPDCQEQQPVIWYHGQREYPEKGASHAEGQGKGQGMAIGVKANQRLQQRSRGLEGKGDQPDLGEAEIEPTLDQRIQRQDQRLHHVVEKMRHTDRPQDAIGRLLPLHPDLIRLRHCAPAEKENE